MELGFEILDPKPSTLDWDVQPKSRNIQPQYGEFSGLWGCEPSTTRLRVGINKNPTENEFRKTVTKDRV